MLDPIAHRLEYYMDLLSARQKLVGSNIANVDTPGYRTQDIDFHFEFMSELEGLQPNVIQPDGLKVKPDGNDVNLDRETRLLAENAIRFNAATNLLRAQIGMVRNAIQEGK
jgi:flagellar basal-body rod protein FlgB